ncbi:MAG: WG repeat-containing protein [Crocinitomicaceae bacterium]|nr:WG repeat-containing protein [Crocinitomicaceae bacterium]
MIDQDGEVILEPQYDTIVELAENSNIFRYRDHDKYGYAIKLEAYNQFFWDVSECVYDSIYFLGEPTRKKYGSEALIFEKDSKYSYRIIEIFWDSPGVFKGVTVDGTSKFFHNSIDEYDSLYLYPGFSVLLIIKKNNLYGIQKVEMSVYSIDKQSLYLFEPQWDSITNLSPDGYFSVWKDGRMAFFSTHYRACTEYLFESEPYSYTTHTGDQYFITFYPDQPIKIFDADSLYFIMEFKDQNGSLIISDSIFTSMRVPKYFEPGNEVLIYKSNVEKNERYFVTSLPSHKGVYDLGTDSSLTYELMNGPYFSQVYLNTIDSGFVISYNTPNCVYDTRWLDNNLMFEYLIDEPTNSVILNVYYADSGVLIKKFDRKGMLFQIDGSRSILYRSKINKIDEERYFDFGEYREHDNQKVVGYVKFNDRTGEIKFVRYRWLR